MESNTITKKIQSHRDNLICIDWCSLIGFPNVFLVFAYSIESSKDALATPTPLAATLIRPNSNPAKICFNPLPSISPIRLEIGTLTFSNVIKHVPIKK